MKFPETHEAGTPGNRLFGEIKRGRVKEKIIIIIPSSGFAFRDTRFSVRRNFDCNWKRFVPFRHVTKLHPDSTTVHTADPTRTGCSLRIYKPLWPSFVRTRNSNARRSTDFSRDRLCTGSIMKRIAYRRIDLIGSPGQRGSRKRDAVTIVRNRTNGRMIVARFGHSTLDDREILWLTAKGMRNVEHRIIGVTGRPRNFIVDATRACRGGLTSSEQREKPRNK